MAAPHRIDSRRALAHLRGDPRLAQVIERVGRFRFQARHDATHFESLARAIVYQQLSGKAAATIYGRLCARFDGGAPTPAGILAAGDEELRAVGLSRQKLGYLRDLAARVASGEVALSRVHRMDDATITEQLIRVKGIGVWTAQMFLMFRLGRPDVLPVLDLGIQKAVQTVYGLRKRPTPQRVAEIGQRWRPWATVACWYLWRSLES
jgi:DNA-3-methyladenine glycosylase II